MRKLTHACILDHFLGLFPAMTAMFEHLAVAVSEYCAASGPPKN